MVDPTRRRLAAALIRQLLNTEITNDDYDNDFPENAHDLGLSVIYDRIWLYYSGMSTHHLPVAELEPETVAMFHRCILFLKCDFEYVGPLLRSSLKDRFKKIFSTSGVSTTVLSGEAQAASSFHTAFWPFSTAQQYQQAIADDLVESP